MNNGRDCPHGRQVGKCDTCDLIEAEKEIEALKARIGQLLNPAKEAAEALGFASHHLRGRASENMLMDMAEKADALISAIGSTPAQCLAEIKARAVEDALRMVYHEEDDHRGYYSYQALAAYANQLRQQAKRGGL